MDHCDEFGLRPCSLDVLFIQGPGSIYHGSINRTTGGISLNHISLLVARPRTTTSSAIYTNEEGFQFPCPKDSPCPRPEPELGRAKSSYRATLVLTHKSGSPVSLTKMGREAFQTHIDWSIHHHPHTSFHQTVSIRARPVTLKGRMIVFRQGPAPPLSSASSMRPPRRLSGSRISAI